MTIINRTSSKYPPTPHVHPTCGNADTWFKYTYREKRNGWDKAQIRGEKFPRNRCYCVQASNIVETPCFFLVIWFFSSLILDPSSLSLVPFLFLPDWVWTKRRLPYFLNKSRANLTMTHRHTAGEHSDQPHMTRAVGRTHTHTHFLKCVIAGRYNITKHSSNLFDKLLIILEFHKYTKLGSVLTTPCFLWVTIRHPIGLFIFFFFTESCHGSHNPSKSRRHGVSIQLEHPVKCEALGGKKTQTWVCGTN